MAGISFNGPASPLARRIGWAVGVAIVVVLIALGGRTTPVEGASPERIRNITEQLKCLQCVGENVADAQSDYARMIREEVERQVRAGRTDDEIFTALVNSYGDRVLLNPRATGVATLVWVLPVLVIGSGVAGLGIAFATARARREASAAFEIDPAEEAKVAAALAELRRDRGSDALPAVDPVEDADR